MQRIRDFLVVLLIGFVLGASVGIGIYTRTILSERGQHELVVADWERRTNELNNQLREARALDAERRKLDEERRAMDAEIERTLREGLGDISKARSDYERGLIQLRFAKDIFEVLRRRYDPAYHGAAPAVP
jgi:NAD(P)-dependent dehydrogenase (short-subunit alcohol dehydrogenase family)